MCSQVQGLASAPRIAQFVLEAIDEFGARSTVEEVTLVFEFRDPAVAAYGPDGKACSNNGQTISNYNIAPPVIIQNAAKSELKTCFAPARGPKHVSNLAY